MVTTLPKRHTQILLPVAPPACVLCPLRHTDRLPGLWERSWPLHMHAAHYFMSSDHVMKSGIKDLNFSWMIKAVFNNLPIKLWTCQEQMPIIHLKALPNRPGCRVTCRLRRLDLLTETSSTHWSRVIVELRWLANQPIKSTGFPPWKSLIRLVKKLKQKQRRHLVVGPDEEAPDRKLIWCSVIVCFKVYICFLFRLIFSNTTFF